MKKVGGGNPPLSLVFENNYCALQCGSCVSKLSSHVDAGMCLNLRMGPLALFTGHLRYPHWSGHVCPI